MLRLHVHDHLPLMRFLSAIAAFSCSLAARLAAFSFSFFNRLISDFFKPLYSGLPAGGISPKGIFARFFGGEISESGRKQVHQGKRPGALTLRSTALLLPLGSLFTLDLDTQRRPIKDMRTALLVLPHRPSHDDLLAPITCAQLPTRVCGL